MVNNIMILLRVLVLLTTMDNVNSSSAELPTKADGRAAVEMACAIRFLRLYQPEFTTPLLHSYQALSQPGATNTTLSTAENATVSKAENTTETIATAENITISTNENENTTLSTNATVSTAEHTTETTIANTTETIATAENDSNNTATATNVNPSTAVGPIKTEGLTLTLFGIDELENEEEWSEYTAAFLTHYFKVVGGENISEATIDINVDYFCGCPTCTPDIWSTDACDDTGFCSTCGERINYVQSAGQTMPMREACLQTAGQEYEEACGKCNPVTCNRDTYCGCPQCTPEVWSREACDENGLCSTCGERITYLAKSGFLERQACIQTAGLDYDVCSPCNPVTCNQPTTYCGCLQCTTDVWLTQACDDNGFCSTCGERINFVQNILGQSEHGACSQIAGLEYEKACGPCDPSVCNADAPDPDAKPTTFCGCLQCTTDVWLTQACDDNGFCSTCGERITYLQSVPGQTEGDACSRTGLEYEEECGLCNPSVCITDTPDPVSKSASITYSQISTYNTSNSSLYGPSYVIQEPFAGAASQSEYISFLQLQSSYYDAVVSVSPVAFPPPLSPPDDNNTLSDGIQTSSPSLQPVVAPNASSSEKIPAPLPNEYYLVSSSSATFCSSALVWILCLSSCSAFSFAVEEYLQFLLN